ncbi:gephyrin-like molybdotransferase receptor GlpR [Kitasatospora sp. NPDC057015]|uniref:divisome protein SepX/GlpR n=1 Tax=Kitasatospora sp. NPDC057015 TaxID=3346001 RepID=UPI003636AE39
MSSSGLIYAVIVGAWAAYLVPMWLRRQDELNEARPTERFSTAIRLLAGRSAMERRASRALGDDARDEQSTDDPGADGPDADDEIAGERVGDERGPGDLSGPGGDPADRSPSGMPAGVTPAPRAPSGPATSEPVPSGPASSGPAPGWERSDAQRPDGHTDRNTDRGPERTADRGAEPLAGRRAGVERRARLLARRRRMVTVLFLAFALGAIVAAVLGLAFLWAPAVPAALLTLYIGHLRKLERQRFEVKLDRDRAAQAAERLRQRESRRSEGGRPEAAGEDRGRRDGARHEDGRTERRPAEARTEAVRPELRAPAHRPAPHDAAHAADRGRPHLRIATDPAPHEARPGTAASALVEATDHEEWVDGMRERGAAGPDSWEPVPVPLPTYVTAPVAPRVTRDLDLGAPGTWNAGRPTDARSTPLFDQYAEPPAGAPAEDGFDSRPRAANE